MHSTNHTDMLSLNRTLCGIPIAGAILSTNHGAYYGLIIFTGACYVGALASLIVARVRLAGWKLTTVY